MITTIKSKIDFKVNEVYLVGGIVTASFIFFLVFSLIQKYCEKKQQK